MKSNFVSDTMLIDSALNLTFSEDDVKNEMLHAVFIPYYTDPNSLELKVVLKRTIMPAQFIRTGKKMGLTALTVELPMDNPLTIDQAFEKLNLNTKIVNAVPFGGVMPDPINSTLAYELILVNIEPLELLYEENGIYFQKPNEYEIGVVSFQDLIEGIKNDIITDLKTRMLLDEFYIMAMEESKKGQPGSNTPHQNNGLNGGVNLPNNYGDQTDTVKTRDIPDDVLEMNARMDQGSIYSKPNGGFKTI